MPELKGTKTEKNLKDAFAGESQARNKYTYFASVARNEGYEQIAAFFLETAEQEKEHAKLHLAALGGIGDTVSNLKAAAEGENEEWQSMYPRMAAEARQEGFEDIARVLDGIGKIENEHRQRYLKLLENVQKSAVFEKKDKTKWVCRNCGFTLEGNKAPEKCPICKHPKAYFQVAAGNY